MPWTRIHRTVGGNGQVTIETGYSTETINLLDWSGGANNGIEVWTSPIDIPIKGDILVLIEFSAAIGDNWLRIEHSIDKSTWHNHAQTTTEVKSTTDAENGDDVSKIAYIDASVLNTDGNKYFFLYDIETHGMAKFTRFGISDTNTDESGTTAKFTLIPHNF